MSNSPSVSQILYDRFAAGNAGFLNPDDFGKICYSLGSYLSPNEIAVAFALIDGDGDGQINREEFLKFWNEDKRFERLQLDETQQVKLYHIGQFFQLYDKDNSGALEAGEFVNMRRDLEQNLYDSKELGLNFNSLDHNADGKISFNEFVFFMIDQGAVDAADGTRPIHG